MPELALPGSVVGRPAVKLSQNEPGPTTTRLASNHPITRIIPALQLQVTSHSASVTLLVTSGLGLPVGISTDSKKQLKQIEFLVFDKKALIPSQHLLLLT